MISPLTLEIFFHIYVTPGELPRPESQGTKETVEWLLSNELVRRTTCTILPIGHHGLELTEKGAVWRDAILSVPAPIQQWIIPTKETK